MSVNASLELSRRRYRGIVYATAGLALVGSLAGLLLEQELAGTLLDLLGAWIAGGIAVLAPRWSEATLQDERDWALHRRASGILVGLAMGVGISVLPVLYVLEAGGYIAFSGVVTGMVVTLSALFLLYGVYLGIAKRRR